MGFSSFIQILLLLLEMACIFAKCSTVRRRVSGLLRISFRCQHDAIFCPVTHLRTGLFFIVDRTHKHTHARYIDTLHKSREKGRKMFIHIFEIRASIQKYM